MALRIEKVSSKRNKQHESLHKGVKIQWGWRVGKPVEEITKQALSWMLSRINN